jgi:hypothetical protein
MPAATRQGQSVQGDRMLGSNPAPRLARPAHIWKTIAAAPLALMFTQAPAFGAACLNEAFGSSVTCSANDFGVASIVVTEIRDDGCRGIGDTVTFDGQLTVASTNGASRYDVGFYIGSDSVQALEGECTVAVVPPGMSAVDDGDSCGDYDGEPIYVSIEDVTVECADADSDGFFDLAVCASYRQNAGGLCEGPAGALPGNSSKCNCQRVVTDDAVPRCTSNADCFDDGNPCTDEICNSAGSGLGDSSGCSHDPNTAPCDDGLFCNGEDTCAAGSCRHEGRPCTLCVETCNESSDSCEASGDAEECMASEICRTSAWWSKHAGEEGDGTTPNVAQELIDVAGGLQICGESVTATSNFDRPYVSGLGLDSALQGLCIKPQGVRQRRLYRELLATALNCTASGFDDCDALVLAHGDVSFSECNEACLTADGGEGQARANECTHALACFNRGGELVDGECATGTCETNTDVYCGSDFGQCPEIEGNPQDCEKFEDTCRQSALCNPELGVCPDSLKATSRVACRQAKKDACTIDSCS